MTKVLSQLLSFLNYRPCTAMDSRSTHTLETLMYNVQCTIVHMIYCSIFSAITLNLLIFGKIFDLQIMFICARIKAFF